MDADVCHRQKLVFIRPYGEIGKLISLKTKRASFTVRVRVGPPKNNYIRPLCWFDI